MSFPILLGRASVVAAAAPEPITRTPDSSMECLIPHKGGSRWSTTWIDPHGFDAQPAQPTKSSTSLRKSWAKGNNNSNFKRVNLAIDGDSSDNEGHAEARAKWRLTDDECRRRTYGGADARYSKTKRYSFKPARSAPAPPPEMPSAVTAEAAHATALAKLTGTTAPKDDNGLERQVRQEDMSAVYAASRRKKRWSVLSLPARSEAPPKPPIDSPVPKLPPHLVLSLNEVAGGMSFADIGSYEASETRSGQTTSLNTFATVNGTRPIGQEEATAALGSSGLGEERRQRRISSRQGLRVGRQMPSAMPLVDLSSDEPQEMRDRERRAKHRSMPASSNAVAGRGAVGPGERKTRRKPPPKYEDFLLGPLPSATLLSPSTPDVVHPSGSKPVVRGTRPSTSTLPSVESTATSQNTVHTAGDAGAAGVQGLQGTGADRLMTACGTAGVTGPVVSDKPQGTTPARPTTAGPPLITPRASLVLHRAPRSTGQCNNTSLVPAPFIAVLTNDARDDSARASCSPETSANSTTLTPVPAARANRDFRPGDATPTPARVKAAAAQTPNVNELATALISVNPTSATTVSSTAPTTSATPWNPMPSELVAAALPPHAPVPDVFAARTALANDDGDRQDVSEVLDDTSESTRDSCIETPNSTPGATPEMVSRHVDSPALDGQRQPLDFGAHDSLLPYKQNSKDTAMQKIGRKPGALNRPSASTVAPVVTSRPPDDFNIRARDEFPADAPLSAVSATFSMHAASAPLAPANRISSVSAVAAAFAARAHCQHNEVSTSSAPEQPMSGRRTRHSTASSVSCYSDATQGSSALHAQTAEPLGEGHDQSRDPAEHVEQTPELDYTHTPPPESVSSEVIQTPALPSVDTEVAHRHLKSDNDELLSHIPDRNQAATPIPARQHRALSNPYAQKSDGEMSRSSSVDSPSPKPPPSKVNGPEAERVTSPELISRTTSSLAQPKEHPPTYDTPCAMGTASSTGLRTRADERNLPAPTMGPGVGVSVSRSNLRNGDNDHVDESTVAPPQPNMAKPNPMPKHMNAQDRAPSPNHGLHPAPPDPRTLRGVAGPNTTAHLRQMRAASPSLGRPSGPRHPFGADDESLQSNRKLQPFPEAHDMHPPRAPSRQQRPASPQPPLAASTEAQDYPSGEDGIDTHAPDVPLKKKRFSLRGMRSTKSLKDKADKKAKGKPRDKSNKLRNSLHVTPGRPETPTMPLPVSSEYNIGKKTLAGSAETTTKNKLRRSSTTPSVRHQPTSGSDMPRPVSEEMAPPVPEKDLPPDPFARPPAPPSPPDSPALRALQSASQLNLSRSLSPIPPRGASPAPFARTASPVPYGRATPSPVPHPLSSSALPHRTPSPVPPGSLGPSPSQLSLSRRAASPAPPSSVHPTISSAMPLCAATPTQHHRAGSPAPHVRAASPAPTPRAVSPAPPARAVTPQPAAGRAGELPAAVAATATTNALAAVVQAAHLPAPEMSSAAVISQLRTAQDVQQLEKADVSVSHDSPDTSIAESGILPLAPARDEDSAQPPAIGARSQVPNPGLPLVESPLRPARVDSPPLPPRLDSPLQTVGVESPTKLPHVDSPPQTLHSVHALGAGHQDSLDNAEVEASPTSATRDTPSPTSLGPDSPSPTPCMAPPNRNLSSPIPPARSPMRAPSPALLSRSAPSTISHVAATAPAAAPAPPTLAPPVHIVAGVRPQSPAPRAHSPSPAGPVSRNAHVAPVVEPDLFAVSDDPRAGAQSPAPKEKRRRRFSFKPRKSESEHDVGGSRPKTAPTTPVSSAFAVSTASTPERAEKGRRRFSLRGKKNKPTYDDAPPLPSMPNFTGPNASPSSHVQSAPTTPTSERSTKRRFSFKPKRKKHDEAEAPPVPTLPRSMSQPLPKPPVHEVPLPMPPLPTQQPLVAPVKQSPLQQRLWQTQSRDDKVKLAPAESASLVQPPPPQEQRAPTEAQAQPLEKVQAQPLGKLEPAKAELGGQEESGPKKAEVTAEELEAEFRSFSTPPSLSKPQDLASRANPPATTEDPVSLFPPKSNVGRDSRPISRRRSPAAGVTLALDLERTFAMGFEFDSSLQDPSVNDKLDEVDEDAAENEDAYDTAENEPAEVASAVEAVGGKTAANADPLPERAISGVEPGSHSTRQTEILASAVNSAAKEDGVLAPNNDVAFDIPPNALRRTFSSRGNVANASTPNLSSTMWVTGSSGTSYNSYNTYGKNAVYAASLDELPHLPSMPQAPAPVAAKLKGGWMRTLRGFFKGN